VEMVETGRSSQAQATRRRGVSCRTLSLKENTLTRYFSWSIVIISNQGIGPDKLINWKKKIPLIASAVSCPSLTHSLPSLPRRSKDANDLTSYQMPEVPFHIFAATGRDQFRKPMPGIWFELCALFAQSGVTIGRFRSSLRTKLC
jgi:hypothetical protein